MTDAISLLLEAAAREALSRPIGIFDNSPQRISAASGYLAFVEAWRKQQYLTYAVIGGGLSALAYGFYGNWIKK
jgi:hypothetical protein